MWASVFPALWPASLFLSFFLECRDESWFSELKVNPVTVPISHTPAKCWGGPRGGRHPFQLLRSQLSTCGHIPRCWSWILGTHFALRSWLCSSVRDRTTAESYIPRSYLRKRVISSMQFFECFLFVFLLSLNQHLNSGSLKILLWKAQWSAVRSLSHNVSSVTFVDKKVRFKKKRKWDK